MNVPLGILAMLGVYLFLHEPKREGKVSIDYKGAILLTLSLSAILFWLVEGGHSFGRLSFPSIVLIVAGVGLFMYFVRIERNRRKSGDAIFNLEESGHLICQSGVVDDGHHFDWHFLLFTDFCDGRHGAACDHCWFHVDSDVHRLATRVIGSGASANPLWNVYSLFCGRIVSGSRCNAFCIDGWWVGSVMGS